MRTGWTLALLLVVASLATPAHAQRGAVRGAVVEAGTGEPLPGANVYLAGTTWGAATEEDGRFSIEAVPAGTYDLAASMVGFAAAHRTVTLTAGATAEVTFRLSASTATIGEAEVVAEQPRRWRRQLRRFERLFFGPTWRGRQCSILNPEVLDFKEHDGAFTATASAPFTYENRALGYRVTHVLQRFRAEGEEVRFGGLPRYEDLEPAGPEERAACARAREEAYAGSFQHFLRALFNGTAAREGFDAYLLDDLRVPRSRPGGRALVPRATFDSLHVAGPTPDERAFAFDRVLHVEYLKEPPHRDAPRTGGNGAGRHQRSTLVLSGPAPTFHRLGYLTEPYAVTKRGYWAWEGHVCDLLPLDYSPPS